jgi:hypothetical protein
MAAITWQGHADILPYSATDPVSVTMPRPGYPDKGLFASGNRTANIARARELLAVASRAKQAETSATAAADEPRVLPRPCRCCDRMMIIETFAAGCQPKHHPASVTAAMKIDTS